MHWPVSGAVVMSPDSRTHCCGAVVMSPDSEGLGAAIEAGVGSNLTQPRGISYFSLYTFF